MKKFIDRSLIAARKYTIIDFAFLKITLFSAGVLVGTYYASFLLSYTLLLWGVFILSWLWIMYRTFFTYMR